MLLLCLSMAFCIGFYYSFRSYSNSCAVFFIPSISLYNPSISLYLYSLRLLSATILSSISFNYTLISPIAASLSVNYFVKSSTFILLSSKIFSYLLFNLVPNTSIRFYFDSFIILYYAPILISLSSYSFLEISLNLSLCISFAFKSSVNPLYMILSISSLRYFYCLVKSLLNSSIFFSGVSLSSYLKALTGLCKL